MRKEVKLYHRAQMVIKYLTTLWNYIALTAPYLIFGLLASGVLHHFFSLTHFTRFFKGKGLFPILRASLLGVPLPLCSCSVIPAAVTLRRNGASRGTTSSFLISTPESGIDSMFVTYSFLDLPMTLIRPLAAFITAIAAGLIQDIFNPETLGSSEVQKKEGEVPESKVTCTHHHHHHHEHSHDSKVHSHQGTFFSHLKGIGDYAFNESSDDLAFWLFIGLLLGAVVNVYIPEEFFLQSDSLGGRLLLLLVGIPFYTCASSSTPIAASMMMKGMSPGCALIFLLAGPSTNLTNMTVLQSHIGKKAVIINIIMISLISLLLSYLVDGLYSWGGWEIEFRLASYSSDFSFLSHFSAVFLLILMGKGIYREKLRKYFLKKKDEKENCSCS